MITDWIESLLRFMNLENTDTRLSRKKQQLGQTSRKPAEGKSISLVLVVRRRPSRRRPSSSVVRCPSSSSVVVAVVVVSERAHTI